MAGIVVQKDRVRMYIGPWGETGYQGLKAENKIGNITNVGDIGGETEEIDTTAIDSMAKEYDTGFTDNGTVEVTQNLLANEYAVMAAYKDNNTDIGFALTAFNKEGDQVLSLAGKAVVSSVKLTGVSVGSLLQVVVSLRVSGALYYDFVDPIGPVFGKQVTKITLSGFGGKSAITELGGTLQVVAAIEPFDAANKQVTYSVNSGSESFAKVSPSGLVTALSNGTATIKATAMDGSDVTGTMTVEISGQEG